MTAKLNFGDPSLVRATTAMRADIASTKRYQAAGHPATPTTEATHIEAREWLDSQPDRIVCPIGGGCSMTLRACLRRQDHFGNPAHTRAPRFAPCQDCEHYRLDDVWRRNKPSSAPPRRKDPWSDGKTQRQLAHQNTCTLSELKQLLGLNSSTTARLVQSEHGPIARLARDSHNRWIQVVHMPELISWLHNLPPENPYYYLTSRLSLFGAAK